MKSRDFVDKLQKQTVPDQDIFGLFLVKEDFEITVPMFNDEEVYLISDEDWAKALEAISFKGIDGIWEQLHEIVEEALHRVYLSKEKS
jgi:hypothetical protein